MALAGYALSPLPQPAPVPVPSSGSPVSPASRPADLVASELRRAGRFDEAIRLLRAEYARTREPHLYRILLGLVEDTGDARALVEEARAMLGDWPGDQTARWMLARGLLFAAATFPEDPSVPAWIREASQLAEGLEKAGFQDPFSPGATVILRMQIAWLERRWEEADRLAVRALERGTTEGEATDLLALRLDVALRQGRLEDAERLMDRALARVEGWKDPSYYQLRTFREESLIVREVYFGKPFTSRDLDQLGDLHRQLRSRGLVDPTLPGDDEVKASHQALRTWIALGEQGDLQGRLALVEESLARPPLKKPRCFYSEAVMSPLRPVYLHLMAGRLCRELGRPEEARQHFQQALELHPDDRLLLQELKGLGPVG